MPKGQTSRPYNRKPMKKQALKPVKPKKKQAFSPIIGRIAAGIENRRATKKYESELKAWEKSQAKIAGIKKKSNK